MTMSFQFFDKTRSVKNKLPNSWTQLSRTENGYVVYRPCDGSTQTIAIEGLTLTINRQIESEQHKIESIVQQSDTTFNITCDNSQLNIHIKWLDKSKTKALWKLDNSMTNDMVKWVMCPTKFKSKFPYVDNPCPNEKIKEKEFLPIDIN